MSDFKLSILVITYNHEKYIVQALNSIVEQHKDFSYEVLIGEDASTDRTADILRHYDPSALQNFRVYYRETNIGALNNILDLIQKAQGEYLIVLEGDDYWISPDKLQRQIEFLDYNKDFIAVSHKCLLVDKNSIPLPFAYSAECYHKDYTLKDFRKGILPGQTTTILYRNIYKNELVKTDLTRIDNFPGDRRFAFLLAANGKIRCWDEKMSAYRYVLLDGKRHSATTKEDRNYLEAQLNFYKSIYTYSKSNRCSGNTRKIAAQCYFKVLFRDQFRKFSIWPRRRFLIEILPAEYKFSIALWILISIFVWPFERLTYKRYLALARQVEKDRMF